MPLTSVPSISKIRFCSNHLHIFVLLFELVIICLCVIIVKANVVSCCVLLRARCLSVRLCHYFENMRVVSLWCARCLSVCLAVITVRTCVWSIAVFCGVLGV